MPGHDIRQVIADLLPQLTNALSHSYSAELKARCSIEDIVHDAYLRALDNLDVLSDCDRATIFAWLRRTANRLVIDRIRRKQYQQLNGSVASVIYANLTSSDQLTPSAECATKEAVESLTAALATLAGEQQTIMQLRYVEQLPFESIAAMINRPAATVRGMHRVALNRLRRQLGRASAVQLR